MVCKMAVTETGRYKGTSRGPAAAEASGGGLGALRGAGVLSLMSSGPGLCGSLEDFHGSRKAFP